MLRPFTEITIQQIPTDKWKNRNLSFILDYVTDYKIESDWESHTNPCTLKFPKNIKLFGSEDGVFTYSNTCNLILGASGTKQSPNIDAFGAIQTNAPLIMKGDLIKINHGYLFRNEKDQDNFCSTGNLNIFNFQINQNNKIGTTTNLFSGYVSEVGSGTPIEITCEDNFYLLKKVPFDKSVWNSKESDGNTSLYGLMNHILKLVNSNFHDKNDKYPKLTLLNIPNSITAQFSLGYLEIGDLTCAQLLDKLKQQYHFQSTFRENTLQFGFPIYIETEATGNLNANSSHFFCFRDIFNKSNQLIASANIFNSHSLDYINKDDVVLSAIVQCKIIKSTGKTTLSGKTKTTVDKLKVLVYWDIVTSSFKSIDLSNSLTKTPLNPEGGERHTFYYPVDNSKPIPKVSDLVRLGTEQLKKYHYTGFKGCFTTFGFPFIQWNDNVNILDTIYSDRNGQYKVKKVVYKGGLNGLSQEIHLDYKIDVSVPKSTLSYSLL